MNAGVFIGAALLLDFLLWLLVLLGWESVSIPADFASTHQAQFEFPYTHGLAASIGWCVVAGALAWVWRGGQRAERWRAAVLIALAVFSHWLLDALVHQPEMPLIGASSAKVGLGLWHNLPVALGVEAALTVGGLWLFVSGSALARGKTQALAALTLLVLAFTLAGTTVAPAPPSPQAMAATSLLTLIVVCVLACWLGRLPRHTSR